MTNYEIGYAKGKARCQERFDIAEARDMGWELPMLLVCPPRDLMPDSREMGYFEGWNKCIEENS